MPAVEFVDFYEVLQVSPKAEMETIKRVHQILSLKYQLAATDNNPTGVFSQLQEAAATLLDPERRAAYDQLRLAQPVAQTPVTRTDAPPPAAVSTAKVLEDTLPTPEASATETPATGAPPAANLDPGRFMQGLDINEEKRRRAGLVEVCYRQRILKPRQPALSMKQLEDGLELTVSDLEASLWYLKENDLIRVSDAGNFSISVRGMNAVEGGFIRFADAHFDMKGFGG
ncbi:MAG: DnaJ domain-containing protein [Bryobacteraceae bacterium]|nr:DnaJ domain-containing protein [Bryobacteraceae bacterium]